MPDKKLRDGAFRKIIDDFTGGYNLDLDPSKIAESEFQVFENLVLNAPGRILNATARKGFERWNIANPTNALQPINSIFEIIWKRRALTDRFLVRTATSLEYCEDQNGVYTNIATGLSDYKMKCVLINDNVYIANNTGGDTTNKVYDGTNYLDIGTPPCYQGFDPELSTQSASKIGTGEYRYLITFLYDGIMESSVILKSWDTEAYNFLIITGTQYDVTLLDTPRIDNTTGKKIHLTGIPTGNARVTGRVIYRTKSDGEVFYYLTTIRDNTTTILLNDDVSDDDLVDEYNGGDGFKNILKPYKSKYHVIHQRRLWQANIQEDQYEAPSTSGIAIAGTGIVSGNISTNATRAAIYSYKFANDIRVIRGKTFTGSDKTIKPPYNGILGALSTAVRYTGHATDTEISLTVIPRDTFCQRTAILRNCCQFISGIAVAGSVLTVTVAAANVFKEGESVVISGVAGFTSNPNGTYVINTVTATTFKITHATVGGSHTANTGVTEGSNFYICGFTQSGSFTDGYSDTYLTGLGVTIETSTGNAKYKSAVISSEADEPEIFPAGNFIDIGRDNGEEIMGIFSDERRLIVFKENSIYEIDTTYQDSSLARSRRIVKNIGAKNGDAIVQIDTSEFIFLGSDDYFYHWNGYGNPRQISRKIQSIINGMNITNIDSAYYSKFNWVIFAYSDLSQDGYDGNLLIYDMSLNNQVGSWLHFINYETSLSLCAPYVTKDRVLIFGTRQSDGYTMTYGDQNYDLISGVVTPIKKVITTKLFKELITIKKIYCKIYSASFSGTDNLSMILGTNVELPMYFSLTPGMNIYKAKVNITGRESYLRIEDTDTGEFSIKEMGFEYIPAHEAEEV